MSQNTMNTVGTVDCHHLLSPLPFIINQHKR